MADTTNIEYAVVDSIDAQELLDFYSRQNHPTRATGSNISRMLKNSHCFVTARCNKKLIGVGRGVTDGVIGYLTECKLDPDYQGPAAITRQDGRIEHDEHGIAREIALRILKSLMDYGVERIDVVAYGTEVDFCEELGFRRTPGLVTLQMNPSKLLEVLEGYPLITGR
ncbi:MAG: hypothetical protein HJJLKODD_01662 [Phycisphaerae bacterium]|nr:hypothetical protein [Phycisphaerae bacterium]